MPTLSTPFQLDCALMAGAVYVSNRDVINQLPVPPGWALVSYQSLPASGFEAASFTDGSQIVISFAGTDPTSWQDWVTNGALAIGLGATQLDQAANFYLQTLAAFPGVPVTFTGHSLGGGLASLMAVLFNQQAVTFDQAPFANSATVAVADGLIRYLTDPARGYNTPALINAEAQVVQVLNGFVNNGTIPNSTNVADFNVPGEFLSLSPFNIFNRIGAQANIPIGVNSVPRFDMHSQGLLEAFLISDQTNSQQSLSGVTFKLTDLLKMMFDTHLYAYSIGTSNTQHPNFIEDIVRNQEGVSSNTALNGAPETVIVANQMVTRFTDDLWKIAQPGGLTLSNNHLTDALVAYAMDKYYNEKTGTPGAGQELYNVGNGYIEFSTASITTNGSMNNGNGYFNPYLDSAYTTGNGYTQDATSLIRSLDNSLGDWYIQAGGSAMVATDSSNVGAFMLGGAGNDNLIGGLGNNLLVAGSGNDLLNGGAGNNVLIAGAGTDSLYGGQGNATLYGGSGNDTFVFDSTNTGTTETINAASGLGNGMLFDGSTQITGSGILQKTDTTWVDGNHDQYVYNPDTGAMTISQGLLGSSGDKIVIDHFNLSQAESSSGYLGIRFGEQLAVAAGANSADDPFTNGGTYTAASQSAAVAVGNVQTVTLYASAASSTDQTVTLTGGNGTAFISTGATLLPFNGKLNLVIPAGQDHVTVGLVDTSNRRSVDAANDSCNAIHYEKSAA